ncbi:MAG: ABC transporter permease [Halanaerobiales bacterium]|nr:ABC transporter permease [Halanaerobiales bacterium]
MTNLKIQDDKMGQVHGLWYDAWMRLKKNPTAMFGLALIIGLALIAIFAPLLAPYDPVQINLLESVKPPSKAHWFGTDYYGRDILSRIIYGARISMTVGFVVEFITLVIGMTLGALAGYFGGKVDMLIMRFTDIVMAFPGLLFIIAVRVALGPGLFNVFLAMSVAGWTGKARIIRSQVLSLREKEFVESARALGAKTHSVILKHILPNCMAPMIVSVTMGVAGAIMAEAGLSFLGLGVQEPIPSWGSIINEGLSYLRTAPWYTLFPGFAIALTVLGFNLLGDGLRDALDPRMKN